MRIANRLMTAGGGGRYGFVDFKDDQVDRTTYSFAGVLLGAAAGNRVIVVEVSMAATGSTVLNANSVTVGGTPADLAFSQPGGGSNKITSAFFTVALASGETGSVVVTANRTAQFCKIGVYAVYGFSATPSDAVGLNWFEQPSGSVQIIAGGGDLVLAAGQLASQTDILWTGVDEDFGFSSATPDSRVEGAGRIYTGSRINRTIGFSASPAAIRAVTAVIALPRVMT